MHNWPRRKSNSTYPTKTINGYPSWQGQRIRRFGPNAMPPWPVDASRLLFMHPANHRWLGTMLISANISRATVTSLLLAHLSENQHEMQMTTLMISTQKPRTYRS